jgi:hypothetical protein
MYIHICAGRVAAAEVLKGVEQGLLIRVETVQCAKHHAVTAGNDVAFAGSVPTDLVKRQSVSLQTADREAVGRWHPGAEAAH